MGSEINTGGTTAVPEFEDAPPIPKTITVDEAAVREGLTAALGWCRRSGDLEGYQAVERLWALILPGEQAPSRGAQVEAVGWQL